MQSHAVLIPIILVPTLHFLVSVLFLGSGLLLLLQEKFPRLRFPAAGNFLAAVAAGVLFNAAQFALVLLVYRRLPPGSRFWLSAGKYAMDLAVLLLVIAACKKKYLPALRGLAAPWRNVGNAGLTLLSLLLGALAVLNFPHVHDSVQLMATNNAWLTGADFWSARRFGLGFASMCYFPAALWRSLPMATLASGFKPALFLLAGQAVIFGIDRLGTLRAAANKYLYFVIVLGSCFGLHGVTELGKDSAWGVLFTLIFFFSLMNREQGQGRSGPFLYAAAAMALGTVTIPYLCVFVAIWITLRLIPERLSAHKVIFPAAVILLLALGTLQMPARLAIANLPHQKALLGNHAYWYPLDGKTTFFGYLFAFARRGYRNPPWLIAAGFLGILLLPLARKRFADAAVRSAALFLPVSASGFLLFTRLARGIIPAGRNDRIPFTPLSFFDAWNLIKDIPQWYVQIISGIFFIILLDTLWQKLPARPWRRRAPYLAISALAAAMILAANASVLASLRRPAFFYSYGGNKNRRFAQVMECIYRNPGLRRFYVQRGTTGLVPSQFNWEIRGYFPNKMIQVLADVHVKEKLLLPEKLPLLLVASRDFQAGFARAAAKYGSFQIRELAYFRDGAEGIFAFGRGNSDLADDLLRPPRTRR